MGRYMMMQAIFFHTKITNLNVSKYMSPDWTVILFWAIKDENQGG